MPEVPGVQANASARTQINVKLFSGGTGTHSITQALLRHPRRSIEFGSQPWPQTCPRMIKRRQAGFFAALIHE